MVAKVPTESGKLLEGAEQDGKLRTAGFFSIETLDAPDNMVDSFRLASIKRQTLVDMEGTNGRDIGFNCLRLQGSVAKGCNPLKQEPG